MHKPGDFDLVHGTHIRAEGENQLHGCLVVSICVYMCMPTDTLYTYIHINNL